MGGNVWVNFTWSIFFSVLKDNARCESISMFFNKFGYPRYDYYITQLEHNISQATATWYKTILFKIANWEKTDNLVLHTTYYEG